MINYFFIVGTPRSGTTLLQAILMSGEGVYVPPETGFLAVTRRNRLFIGDIEEETGWRRAVSEVRSLVVRDRILRNVELFDDAASSAPRTYRGLFKALLDSVALEEGASWIGEKSPVHTRDILFLNQMFPEGKIVQIVRDPRDVALSQQEAWGTRSLQAALRWRRDTTRAMESRRLLSSESYTTVRYEELVGHPEVCVRRLCDFLGLPFRSAMLLPHLRSRPGFVDREHHKNRTLEPVTSSRVGRFRTRLSSTDLAVVEHVCAGGMAEFEYERTGLPRSSAVRAAMRQLPALTAIHLRRRFGSLRRFLGDRLRAD